MIEVVVDSIRYSLTRQDRAILLKESEQERQLPIYIGRAEAEAILFELKEYPHPRPLTHDLLKECITALGGALQYIFINDLHDDIFFAVLHIVREDQQIDIDARPSDSIALAVRARVPIYVAEHVMDKAAVLPAEKADEDKEHLAVFRDFVNSLDLGSLEEE
ncbi:MAG: bifunctional nuclease family protein [Anaerolineae bacterium]|nr:bifunctional nuclease family protein [Anaerolineae bacterium]